MTNPLLVAHRIGRKDDRYLQLLFARYLGSTTHPRGRILSAYRNARKSIKRSASITERLSVLEGLRYGLTGIAQEAMRNATARGTQSGIAQVAAYREDGAQIYTVAATTNIDDLLAAWLAEYDTQSRQARALLTAGAVTSVIGDNSRMGILTPGALITEGARWLATGLHTSVEAQLGEPVGNGWGKQALPNIDERTTDCCLQVAGQVQKFDVDFILTGTPRFADRQHWSPFHWNCRTSCVLYRASYDDGITQSQVERAKAERQRRAEVAAEKKAAKEAKES